MKPTFPLLALVAMASTACDRIKPPITDSARFARPYSMAAMDSEVGVVKSCEFVKVNAHPDPIVFLREFVDRTTTGQLLRGDQSWFAGAMDCPGQSPRIGNFTLIGSYEMGTPVVAGSTASVVVTARGLGRVVQTTLRWDSATVTDTVRARLTKFGWRVASPPPTEIVLASSPRTTRFLRFEDSVAVASVLKRQAEQRDLAAQQSAVRRLPLSEFPALGREVRYTLGQRGCTVPQEHSGEPHNIVAGMFTEAGRPEWAVLCSVDATSQILIVDARTGAVADSLERTGDAAWVQSAGEGRWEYSRHLTVLTRAAIAEWKTDTDGQPIPQPIDHDALQQAFSGKYSVAFYFAGGRWFRMLTGD